MLLDITYAHPNVFISNSACEKTQCNSMPLRRKLSDLDRGRAIGWHNCTHTLVIRWNHIKIWDHSIQNFVFGTSVNSWSLTYFEQYNKAELKNKLNVQIKARWATRGVMVSTSVFLASQLLMLERRFESRLCLNFRVLVCDIFWS